MSQFKNYLVSVYQSSKIQDDKLSIAPCSEFINLALVEKNFGSSGITKTSIDVDAILMPNFQFVLVEGPAGMGKSTLCWELCRKWDTFKSLQHFKIVLLLKLRDVRVQKATTLNDIFYHRNKALSRGVVDEVFRCEGEGVLLILDGFDEMPTSVIEDKSSLIMELVSTTCLPRATRLVTSRPSALHQKEEYVPCQYRHIEILGFTDDCKVVYALLAFRSEPDLLRHFISFICANPVINSFAYVPVNCAIIAQVYKEIKSKLVPKTMTQLYTTLVLVLIRRHMIERGKWNRCSGMPSSLRDVPEEVTIALKRVSELAYGGLFEQSTQLVFTESDVGKGFQHLGLLSETKEMYVCEGARTSYSFFHLSMQEFLAAWHVSQNPELINRAISMGSHQRSGLITFAPFLSGMIGSCSLPVSNSLTGSAISCCYEAQDCSKLKQLSLHRFDMCLNNPLETYAFGYVLVHAPIQWHLVFADTPFYILPSSLVDHIDSSGLIQGSIVDLRIDSIIPPYFSPNIGVLSECLLEHITELRFQYRNNVSIAQLGAGIPALNNLQTVSLQNLNYEVCDDDYLLYQSLKHSTTLKKLEIAFFYISDKGIVELSSTLAACPMLELVRLIYSRFKHYNNVLREIKSTGQLREFPYERKIHRIVEGALSCRTLKSLATNIRFTISGGTTAPLEHVLFQTSPVHYFYTKPVPLFDCLVCIADMCKMPSMKTLWIMYEGFREFVIVPRRTYSNFLTILNNSLYLNPSMHGVRVDSHILTCCDRDVLFDALSRNPQKVRQRCNSLPDLNAKTVYATGSDRGLSRTLSCPALHVLTSLHPGLNQAFRCHELYHTADCRHTMFAGLQPPGLLIF